MILVYMQNGALEFLELGKLWSQFLQKLWQNVSKNNNNEMQEKDPVWVNSWLSIEDKI